MSIRLLNIPNFCVSYYLFGIKQRYDFDYVPNSEYSKFNFRPLAILEKNGKIIIIDNSDPVGVDMNLLDASSFFFATNKLLGDSRYEHDKIFPLFPHYPIDTSGLYLEKFWKGIFSKNSKKIVKEIYRLQKRPKFQLEEQLQIEGNTIFFSGSIWKNEPEANEVRYRFIKFCMENPLIKFEGGLLPRDDGNNFGYDEVISPRRYSPIEFLNLSKKSLFGFNNAAVKGAISWRVAEYLNHSIPIVSLPFKIEIPKLPIHGKQVHFIDTVDEIPEFLNFALSNNAYLNQLSQGGADFFKEFCLPEVQAKSIFQKIDS